MPIYEYLCTECNGVFEMIRPVRDARDTRPCPVCDTESERLMSYTFSAYTMRNGNPRMLPDRGKFWHLGKEVDKPVTGSVAPNDHPEINRPDPPKPLSVEEVEEFEHLTENAKERGAEQSETLGVNVQGNTGPVDPVQFTRRLRTRGTQREERAKRRLLDRYSS